MNNIDLPVCVRLIKNDAIMIRAEQASQIIRLEGNWYFHPSLIDQHHFKITDRLYTCPHKGTCNWVDYEFQKLYLPDVAWVYPETFAEYSQIVGWYGFNPSTTHYEIGDCKIELLAGEI